MEVINISSYYEFLKHFKEFPRSDRCLYYYRGINASFQIIPSICYADCQNRITDFKGYEKCLIAHFYREISTKYGLNRLRENDWELWFLARHFGLKSRLIDFTRDDRVAIQFAMESSSDGTARIFCLNESGIELKQDDDLCQEGKDPYTFNRLCMIHPGQLYEENAIKKLGIGRIFIQMGNFLYQPVETIRKPITEQIPQEHWKVFEIKKEYFDKIKKEIFERDCRFMDKPLLKEITPLDEACKRFNESCIR